MARYSYVISVSERSVDQAPGEAVYDMAWHHENYPSHAEVIKLLQEHFNDWQVSVIPV